jgi:hypothetical protein
VRNIKEINEDWSRRMAEEKEMLEGVIQELTEKL